MNSIEFVFSEPIDLTNCDREPIHIPGQIQPHGVLLALQEPQLTILQVSQNTDSWLGVAAETLVGQNLSVLFSEAQIEQITTYLEHDNLSIFNPFEIILQPRWIHTDPNCPHPLPLPQEREQSQINSAPNRPHPLPLPQEREQSQINSAPNRPHPLPLPQEREPDFILPSPDLGEGLGVRAETIFKGILHRSQGIVVLELEPCRRSTENHSLLGFYPLLQQAISSIRSASDLTHLAEIVVQEVRRMTGFDRVMVYRFEADHSGVVVAEDKRADLEGFLGLHYPASDIPMQARKLYYEKWLRIVPNVHYQPAKLIPSHNPLTDRSLDLSASVLRSVSPLHIEYLQNMGVEASMSISLITEKRLWGLIACHHYAPQYVDYETRQACEFLGQIASVELVRQQDQTASRYRQQVKSIQDQFRQAFTQKPGFIGQVLQCNQSVLLNLVEAEGAAIVLDNQLTLIGHTPSETDTHNLVLWLLSQPQQDLFYTDALPQLYADAKPFKDCASGILAISIFLSQKSYHILWFRPEQIQTVHWAGDPHKPVSVTDNGEVRLSPRQSFDLWKETVQEKSFPWQLLEIEAAQEMRNTLTLAVLEFSQVALEQAAERAAIASRAKSQFLAKMSHELRTPLNAILGFTQIMSRDRSLPPEYQEHLGIISRSGEHLLALINDVLEMSKIEAGQLILHNTCFDLHRLIYSIKDLFLLKASDKALKLNAEQSPELPQYVCGDEGKLRQILINLVANAVKFTTTGHVTLRAKAQPFADAAAISPTSPTPYTLQFEVEDSGPGIEPEESESIFEAFMQTERGRHMQGSGLGLSISRQFARLMAGDVTVQSTVGKGTIFTCCVQLTVANAVDILPVTVPRRVIGLEPEQPHYQILIVEDILENRQLLLKLLEMVGFTVHTVKNGLEAISCWEEWRPDLILMDVQMPVMDGHEATRQIRARQAKQADGANKTVIIALTANAFQEDRQAALQSGCDNYVSKPFAENTLFDKLAQHLGVRYLYTEEPLPEPFRSLSTWRNQSHTPPKPLTPQDLQIMPAAWIASVRQAARVIDEATLYELIDQVPAQEHQLVDALKCLVNNFHFETIVELTQP